MHVTLIGDARAARLLGWSTSVPGTYTTNTTASSIATIRNALYSTFQVTVTGTGAVSATVQIQVSNDDVNFNAGAAMNWCATPALTISVSGTTTATDGALMLAAWKYCRATVTAISGTGAVVSVAMGG